MSPGAGVLRLLGRVLGWRFISVEGRLHRVFKTREGHIEFAYINGRRYTLGDNGYLKQWLGQRDWKRYSIGGQRQA